MRPQNKVMSHWRRSSVGELCGEGVIELQTGPFGSQLHAHDYVPHGVPVVPTEALRGRRIDHSVLPQITTEKAETLERHRLKIGDILFARRGAQATGHTGFVRTQEEGFLCGTGAIRLRVTNPQSQTVLPEFLSHVFADPASVAWFKFHAIGATMPNLNEGIIRSFPLLLPPAEDQKAIANSLTALDDKIELNRRTNETLEAIAHALFKSWFVDFDPVRTKAHRQQPAGVPLSLAEAFPSHLVDSGLGPIPEGWQCKPLPEVIAVNPIRVLDKQIIAPYVDMGNIPTHSARVLGWFDRKFTSGMRFENGDTLVARITPCLENGKTAFVDFLKDKQVAWGSTEFIVLHPKPPLPPEYGYFLARSAEFRAFAASNMSGTSGRQRVPADCFASFYVAVPPQPIAKAFCDLARSFFAKTKQNDEESTTLALLRNALLPKLLSGKVRIKQAEGIVEVHA